MYEIFKSVITSKSYNLEQMIKKINTRWVEDALTEEQREELIALAQTNADPSQSNIIILWSGWRLWNSPQSLLITE